MTMIEELRESVKKLFQEKKVDIVVGYEMTDSGEATPCFIEGIDEIEKLTWNELCVFNLAVYLKDMVIKHKPNKIGIIAKGCDVKAIVGLIQEHQLKREDIFIIGVECHGQKECKDGKFLFKCQDCPVTTPQESDILIKDPKPQAPQAGDYLEAGPDLERMSVEERWDFWNKQFAKCIRCYACRNVCPFCYCRECLADSAMPKWCSPVPSQKGNFMWNIIRAYHLAGRCIGCGECERACPTHIPLSLLNKKMAKEVKELFGYTPGKSSNVKLPLNDFSENDKEDFIK